jgi:hypothetical protein
VATVRIDEDTITVHLTAWEKAEALHGDFSFPRGAVVGVRVTSSCLDEVDGFKLVGSDIPGSVKVGIWKGGQAGSTFAACHGNGPGIVIDLAREHYRRIVVSHDNPEVLAAQLS